MLSPPVIRMKPTACSYVFGPKRFTLPNCLRSVNTPFSFRYSTIFLATVIDKPATWLNNEAEAVFKLTPTRLTTVSTVKSKLSASSF